MMGEAIHSETLKALVSQHALREVGLSIRLGGPTGQLQFLLGLILRLHLLVRLTAIGRLLPVATAVFGECWPSLYESPRVS